MQEWTQIWTFTKGRQPEQHEFSYACGFVLAGGKSSRMGRDKALLKVEGETLIERAIRKLRRVCPEVAIAGGGPELARYGRVIPDGTPGQGPLGGIVAALQQSAYEWNLFLAVDMPFVPESVLRSVAFSGGGPALLAVAQAEGVIQPLCGIYSRAALPLLRRELEAGRLKMKDAIVATEAYSYTQIDCLDWFRNINTPEDLEAVTDLSRE